MRAAAARSDAASHFKVSVQLDCAHQVIKILAIEPLVIEHRLHRWVYPCFDYDHLPAVQR